MGGGDLNLKKSWHPGLMKNQSAVWEREQEALEERKMIAERQREIQEERELNELQAMQEANGGKRRVDRVDWMYAAPQGGNMGVTSEVEAFLLGKNTVQELLQQSNNMGSLQQEEKNSFVRTGSATASAKDVVSKVRDDPMLVIKKEQQAMVNALRNNPQRLRELIAAREKSSDSGRISKGDDRHRSSGSHNSHSTHRAERDSSRSTSHRSHRPHSDSHRSDSHRPESHRSSSHRSDYHRSDSRRNRDGQLSNSSHGHRRESREYDRDHERYRPMIKD
ncbi:Pre-mRNA splicing factor-domain-containing protein [Lipomyces arxii]|uniref:Pre-mRNA splicing factor-domain-containing protein n=1 Tax=Lipomyces arxii TaxID=56418 RepID=UPI0034CF0BB5